MFELFKARKFVGFCYARMVGFEATIWFEPSWECIDFVVIITLGCKFEGKERERWVQEK